MAVPASEAAGRAANVASSWLGGIPRRQGGGRESITVVSYSSLISEMA
jgi:hypothetical protein